MSLYFRSLTLVLAGLASPLGALAQSPQAPAATSPSQSSAQSEAGEPRAATSADVGAAPTEVPAPAGARAAGAGTAGAATAGTPAHPSAHPPAPAASGPGGKTAADRLELGTATVTGDREQPKVMYIVPWKKSDIGDLSGKPMNSLLDEALAPVDRDEFKRQVMYYQVVKADASQNGASKAPAAQGEK